MLQLPPELRHQCFDYLRGDIPTLKAARLVNYELGRMATKILFQSITLYQDNESVDRFNHLVQSDFRSLARRVVIDTTVNANWDGVEESEPLNSFLKAIAVMPKLENLEEVHIKFSRECWAEDEEYDNYVHTPESIHLRGTLLKHAFNVMRQVDKLKSLTIINLQEHTDAEVFECEDFIIVRGKLKELHLMLTSEDDEGFDPGYQVFMSTLHKGYSEELPNVWLKPLGNQLTHLSLYSSFWKWGVVPLVDFREIPPFPGLVSLCLGKLTIGYDWQIEWILAHGPTLRELSLDECMILIEIYARLEEIDCIIPDLRLVPKGHKCFDSHRPVYYKTFETRWHMAFHHFCTGLPKLRRFSFGAEPYDGGYPFESRYELLSSLYVPRYSTFNNDAFDDDDAMYFEMKAGFAGESEDSQRKRWLKNRDELDGAALKTLLKVVNARAELDT